MPGASQFVVRPASRSRALIRIVERAIDRRHLAHGLLPGRPRILMVVKYALPGGRQ